LKVTFEGSGAARTATPERQLTTVRRNMLTRTIPPSEA
jgi:hypothetical protein